MMVKIKQSGEGKKLISYLKSLSFVEVLGDSDDFVDVKDLKKKVKKAEKSKSLSLDESIRRSAAWKSRYR